jgi:hypothetical protein
LLMKMFTALFCKEGYYTLQISWLTQVVSLMFMLN